MLAPRIQAELAALATKGCEKCGLKRWLPALALLLVVAAAAASPLERELRQVERIRGLKFLREVRTATISRDEVSERLRAQIVKSMPYSLDDYVLVLRALHLVEESDGDPAQRLFALLEQQVLAYYDPLSHTYYELKDLPPAAAGLVPPSLVAVHELTHALQDQRFDIGRHDLALRDDWDASLAYHAVVEGEATLVMMAALGESTGASLETLIGSGLLTSNLMESVARAAIEPAASRYFVESLEFPYFAGLRLVAEAYRRAGWKGVDALHANPPRSTREVIHSEEYFARVAAAASTAGGRERPPLHSFPGIKGLLTVEHLGEFHWAFLLGAENARGWRGDRVAIVQNSRCEPTVLSETEWDSPERASAFRIAYEQFLREREPQFRVVQQGTLVRVGYGADRALVERFAR